MSGSSEYEKYLNETLNDVSNLQVDWISYTNLPTIPKKLDWSCDNEKYIFESIQNKEWNYIYKFLLSNGFDNSSLKHYIQPYLNTTIDYYTKNPISYNLNSYQFRSDEFSLDEIGNVFLGCSDTFGVGQSLKHTWPYILSKVAFPDDKIYNLGVPGSGSDTAFRILNHLKHKIKIKNIFHWLPKRHRYEFYLGNDMNNPKNDIFIKNNGNLSNWVSGYVQVGPNNDSIKSLVSEDYIKNGLSTNTMLALTDLKNILAIKSIANELGINYYVSNFDIDNNQHDINITSNVYNYLKENNVPRQLLARDLQHMRIYDNTKVVANFLTSINKNII